MRQIVFTSQYKRDLKLALRRNLTEEKLFVFQKNSMRIAVFCGSSMPHNKEIVEAAASQQNHAEKLMHNI